MSLSFSTRTRTAIVLALIALVVFTAWIVLLPPGWIRNLQKDNGGQSQESVDAAAIAAAFNEGLAHLENGTLERSNVLFAELAQQLPDDPLPARNLAVSLVMSVTDPTLTKTDEQRQVFVDRAVAAVRQVQTLEPKSDIGFLLESQLMQAIGKDTEAIAAARTAAERNPESAANWYQLYSVMQSVQDAEIPLLRREAIAKAYSLAPANLVVLTEQLRVQTDSADDGIVSTLEAAIPLYDRLADGILQRTRVNPRQFLTGALEAARGSDWRKVAFNVGTLRNLTVPDDAAKSDRRRVERNPLEFVLRTFGPNLQHAIDDLAAADEQGFDVTFEFQPLNTAAISSGAVDLLVADFNLDRRADLAVRLPDRVAILAAADEGVWKSIADIPSATGTPKMLAADLDTDGNDSLRKDRPLEDYCHTADLELLLFGADGIELFEARLEELGGALTYVPMDPGEELRRLRGVTLIRVADLNSDGDLDLIVISDEGLSFWSNNGTQTFIRQPLEPDWGKEVPVDCFPVDWDRDIDMDVIVTMRSGTVGILENLRLGTFRWSLLEPNAPESLWAGNSDPSPTVTVADTDNDGNWELLLGSAQRLWRIPTTFVEPGKVRLGTGQAFDLSARGIQLWDYDNDGAVDLLLGGTQTLGIIRGLPPRSFKDMTGAVFGNGVPNDLRRAAVGDLDADGDEDFVVLAGEAVRVGVNQGGNAHHWIDVGLLAEQQVRGQTTESGRVNHYGLGSIVELRAGPKFQQRLVTAQTTHFGLGPNVQADAVRVLWTNGIPENVVHPQANSLICEKQSLKGSCPYLYAWNGERFEFVTDLLWASPIGLHDPQGELVPSREWEYLKIPGEALVEKGGEYVLQITEELWEFAYFDQVELIAVDHPADVEIFTNDKVGPPSLTQHHVHTVRQPRRPVAARNHNGRDLLPELLVRDERYAQIHDRKRSQGYTEDCFVELDLGLSERPQSLKLFLTGWILPTDTSINVALQENPLLPGPRAPWLSVPNESGEFVEVVPFMGFPGGKTKTIVVDISEIFPADDFRIRIHTSNEIYWDEIFFTVDEPPAPMETQSLELLSADLHFRGVSARIEHPHRGPERYDYDQVTSDPAWPALSGRVTRFGDVTPLIRRSDDLSVVMITGDEMTVRFQTPERPLPQGWKRDFLLHNVGWDKDGDLQTVYGQTVEPYPFRAMRRYPYWPEQSAPDRPEFQEYLKIYQTREIPPRGFVRSFRNSR